MEVIDRVAEELDLHLPQYIVLALIALLLVDQLTPGASALWRAGAAVLRFIRNRLLPHRRNEEVRRRTRLRRMFADHVESQIRALNTKEEWRDDRFSELEAEIEAEGRQHIFGSLVRLLRSTEGLRREKSLTKALEESSERLILLEGDPGSGKSVALRHLSQLLARRAMNSNDENALIPIYINLKELERENRQIDAGLIKDFVLETLHRGTTSDVDRYVDSEFDRGLEDGTWLFLFDSFDELPEVLSSIEVDTAIEGYAAAIYNFLHGMNACRGIVASRHFRAPKGIGWPRFRIVPLSETRKRQLIHRALLSDEVERMLIDGIPNADPGIRSLSSNPMFLGLLCEYAREKLYFPRSSHSVFDTYIERRLQRDRSYLESASISSQKQCVRLPRSSPSVW